MVKEMIIRCFIICNLALAMPIMTIAETIGIFYDTNVKQIEFAAEDVKTALESKGLSVEMLDLNKLNADYPNKKVIIAPAANSKVKTILAAAGGTIPTGLGEQAYALRTTTQGQTSFWALGGDNNGAMYGGLQLAENFNINGFTGSYNEQESPAILKRGIKLNLPFDKESGTYGRTTATSKINAIPNVWDMTFWESWFDTMARNRYNLISVWSNHPFTSFVKVPGYEDCAIQNVTGIGNSTYSKTMSIDEKIVFWKQVMAYAHGRGFEFYLFNWNLFLDNADGKYGIDAGLGKVTNQANIDYMRKSMKTLWETYPDLDGFGITQGESMSNNDHDDALFLAKTYGQGTLDYAINNPDRKIRFIHRWHLADFTDIKTNFAELLALPNITFEMSFKYSLAHMHSIATPDRMRAHHINPLVAAGLKSFLTVRNDDFYYHNWGDPDFARAYINGMIKKGYEGLGNTGNWFVGFYMGQDSYSPTRTFFSKNSVTQGMLDVERQWYMHMLWGRLSYNPNTSDAVFKNIMASRFPTVSSEDLFTAWQKTSRTFTTLGELITGTLGRDNQWWPEACQAISEAHTIPSNNTAFITIADFADANPERGSNLASIAATAAGELDGKKSAFVVADEIENDALTALSFANTILADANTDMGVMVNNLKAMSYLSIYYAYKIRGAIYSKQTNKTSEARDAMGNAYCWWINYANLMDANFTGMDPARSANLPNWHTHDKSVLKEFTDLGGEGVPSCNLNLK